VRLTLIEAQYLPPVAYFAALLNADEIVVEKHEHYEKQTYRNRCYINTVHGKEALIVPLTSKHGKTKIMEVRIDYRQKWLNNHWRAIQSAYGKAPYFDYYADSLHDVLFRKSEFLYDLNVELLTMCLKWLRWDLPIRESLAYQVTINEPIIDLRSAISPKKGEMLARFYKPAAYYQVFGNKFVENLSLIDLIFCEGPGAAGIVQASAPKMNN
jgi:hypothetical protein